LGIPDGKEYQTKLSKLDTTFEKSSDYTKEGSLVPEDVLPPSFQKIRIAAKQGTHISSNM
jgi:hypothetical protein